MDYTKIIERARKIYANPKEALKENVVISNEGTVAAIKVALLELFSKEELAESEDERIRKDLICEVQSWDGIPQSKREKYIAYLEKQNAAFIEYGRQEYFRGRTEAIDEQQPAEFKYSDDEKLFQLIEDVIRVYGKTQGEWIGGVDMDTLVMFLRRLRDKQPAEWSEEDDEMAQNVYESLYAYQCDIRAGRMDKNAREILDDVDAEKEWVRKLRTKAFPKLEWSGENESDMKDIIKAVVKVWDKDDANRMIRLLKSLRPQPHWKPSEKQMNVFLKANPINLMPEELSVYKSLCNDLKKL